MEILFITFLISWVLLDYPSFCVCSQYGPSYCQSFTLRIAMESISQFGLFRTFFFRHKINCATLPSIQKWNLKYFILIYLKVSKFITFQQEIVACMADFAVLFLESLLILFTHVLFCCLHLCVHAVDQVQICYTCIVRFF